MNWRDQTHCACGRPLDYGKDRSTLHAVREDEVGPLLETDTLMCNLCWHALEVERTEGGEQ